MNWVAIGLVVLTALSACVGALKDFSGLTDSAPTIDAEPAENSSVRSKTDIKDHRSQLVHWLLLNRLPLAKVFLAILAAVFSLVVLRKTDSASKEALGREQQVKEDNDRLTLLLAGSRNSRPTIRLFIRQEGASHDMDLWRDEILAANDAPHFQKINTIGLLGTSARRELFYASAEQGKLSDMEGEIDLYVGLHANQMDVHRTGLTLQLPTSPSVKIDRQGFLNYLAVTGDGKSKSDAFAVEFPLAAEWKWDVLLAWVKQAVDEEKPLIKIRQFYVATCPKALPTFSEATVIYELQEMPRFAVFTRIKPEHMYCADHLFTYDLVPLSSQIMTTGTLF